MAEFNKFDDVAGFKCEIGVAWEVSIRCVVLAVDKKNYWQINI